MFFRKKKTKETTQEKVASVFSILESIEKHHLIYFDKKERRLFIEQPIAVMMLQQEDGWTHFLQNCMLWITMRLANEAWEKYFVNEEIKAVHRARRKLPHLTPNDIDRIKRTRRNEIAMMDMTPPKIDSFEFYIIKESSSEDNDIPSGKILAVGKYDADKDEWEATAWRNIKNFMTD